MRAVIDTNVLLSALLWGGTPRTLLEHVRNGTQLGQAAALSTFNDQVALLQAERKIPTQNWFMRIFAPDFTFEAKYGVLLSNNRIVLYDSLDAAIVGAGNLGGKLLAGVTQATQARFMGLLHRAQ